MNVLITALGCVSFLKNFPPFHRRVGAEKNAKTRSDKIAGVDNSSHRRVAARYEPHASMSAAQGFDLFDPFFLATAVIYSPASALLGPPAGAGGRDADSGSGQSVLQLRSGTLEDFSIGRSRPSGGCRRRSRRPRRPPAGCGNCFGGREAYAGTQTLGDSVPHVGSAWRHPWHDPGGRQQPYWRHFAQRLRKGRASISTLQQEPDRRHGQRALRRVAGRASNRAGEWEEWRSAIIQELANDLHDELARNQGGKHGEARVRSLRWAIAIAEKQMAIPLPLAAPMPEVHGRNPGVARRGQGPGPNRFRPQAIFSPTGY